MNERLGSKTNIPLRYERLSSILQHYKVFIVNAFENGSNLTVIASSNNDDRITNSECLFRAHSGYLHSDFDPSYSREDLYATPSGHWP